MEFSRLLEKLEDRHRDLVMEMGMAGLLDLRIKTPRNFISYELLRRYDVENSSLKVHGRDIPINEGHVSWVLGLPAGGIDLSTLKFNKKEVCKKYGIKGSKLKRKDLAEELLQTDIGERWMALFVLFATDCVLRPSYTYYVSHKVLRVMAHRHNLKAVNWSKYVLDGLVEGAKKLENTNVEMSAGQKAYVPIHGCTVFLEVRVYNFFFLRLWLHRMLWVVGQCFDFSALRS